MYFSTCNHYLDEMNTPKLELEVNLNLNLKDNNEEKLCIICWDNEGVIADLQTIVKDSHKCKYNGQFHNKCLYIWFSKNNYCPMCRQRVDGLNIISKINIFNYNIDILLDKTVGFVLLYLKYCNSITQTIIAYYIAAFIFNAVIGVLKHN